MILKPEDTSMMRAEFRVAVTNAPQFLSVVAAPSALFLVVLPVVAKAPRSAEQWARAQESQASCCPRVKKRKFHLELRLVFRSSNR
jgi:hypothetical protein